MDKLPYEGRRLLAQLLSIQFEHDLETVSTILSLIFDRPITVEEVQFEVGCAKSAWDMYRFIEKCIDNIPTGE